MFLHPDNARARLQNLAYLSGAQSRSNPEKLTIWTTLDHPVLTTVYDSDLNVLYRTLKTSLQNSTHLLDWRFITAHSFNLDSNKLEF